MSDRISSAKGYLREIRYHKRKFDSLVASRLLSEEEKEACYNGVLDALFGLGSLSSEIKANFEKKTQEEIDEGIAEVDMVKELAFEALNKIKPEVEDGCEEINDIA